MCIQTSKQLIVAVDSFPYLLHEAIKQNTTQPPVKREVCELKDWWKCEVRLLEAVTQLTSLPVGPEQNQLLYVRVLPSCLGQKLFLFLFFSSWRPQDSLVVCNELRSQQLLHTQQLAHTH